MLSAETGTLASSWMGDGSRLATVLGLVVKGIGCGPQPPGVDMFEHILSAAGIGMILLRGNGGLKKNIWGCHLWQGHR